MGEVFISHAQEDGELARQAAAALESAGYSTWYYERDSMPGPSYLVQTSQAIRQARAVMLIISPHSLQSHQVTKEVVRAHEENKPFVPVLHGLTHDQFHQGQDEWREALGSASSITLPPEGLPAVVPRILAGLKAMGIVPRTSAAVQTNGARCALIVDDEQSIRELVSMILKSKAGFQVFEASDGAEGLAMARQLRPTVVITDLVMSRHDGLDMIRALGSPDGVPHLRIVAVTGYAGSEAAGELRRSGITVINKPFRIEELLAAVSPPSPPPAPPPPPPSPPPSALPPPPVASPPPRIETSSADGDVPDNAGPNYIDGLDVRFLPDCLAQMSALGLSEADVRQLVQDEFRGHTNYFRYDLENYPLPVRNSFIVYLSKTGSRVEFSGIVRCTNQQAKLTSWNDILTLYRRATRLAYRTKPQEALVNHGAVGRVAALHKDMRTRLMKHYDRFDGMPIMKRIMAGELFDQVRKPEQWNERTAQATEEIAFHMNESARADQEALDIAASVGDGDMHWDQALGLLVAELERSLQHIHKVLLAFAPVHDAVAGS